MLELSSRLLAVQIWSPVVAVIIVEIARGAADSQQENRAQRIFF